MKKRLVYLIMYLCLFFVTSCNSNNEIITVKDGTYFLEQIDQEEVMVRPSVNISGNNISFSYDMLSSYLSVGTYTIEKDVLTMITDDEKYKYVFQIDGNKLIFLKNESSEVDLIDERFGVNIPNNAEFKLIKE